MRTALLVGMLLIAATPTLAQPVAADYEHRALLFLNEPAIGRVQIAMIRTALAVLNEADTTPSHAQRIRLASHAIKDPAFVAMRMIVIVAASSQVPVSYDSSTTPVTLTIDLTDAQLQTLVDGQWTRLADAFVPSP